MHHIKLIDETKILDGVTSDSSRVYIQALNFRASFPSSWFAFDSLFRVLDIYSD